MKEQFSNSWEDMLSQMQGWVDTLIMNLPNIVLAIVVFVLFVWISRKTQFIIRRPLKKFVKDDSIKHLVVRSFAILFVALGFLLALEIMNLDTALKSLLAGAGVAGLAVGLALQGTLSNTFSGIVLSIKKVINIGDYIETNGYRGTVEKITLRQTMIREADNNIVMIPNNEILENPFKNYALTQRIRTIIECGVGYESDLRKVKEVAIEAVEERFPQDPDKDIEFFFTEFGNSSINFVLRFWVEARENFTILGARSEAIMTIKEAFDKNDINIPFPIRTLEMRNKELSDDISSALKQSN
ncbi:MAG: mechanosensitive ion channel family protein [Saprospiraceae bacterium]|nr:mechanosensitive ion channel family protein [Saprospiraceae bacterium]